MSALYLNGVYFFLNKGFMFKTIFVFTHFWV